MVDFRKALLLLAVMVLATGIASAQGDPLICTANAGVPPTVRAEGIAEEVGQVLITCTGGISTGLNVNIPKVNVQIFMSTNVTSKLKADETISEALLLIDEPVAGSRKVCVLPCATWLGAGAPGTNYVTATGSSNVFQSQTVAGNQGSLVWLGVPFDPPGTTPLAKRTIRIVNVRANASSQLGGSGFVPANIQMFISISGTGGLALSNPVQTVAYVQKGMAFEAGDANFLQCKSQDGDFEMASDEDDDSGPGFRLKFSEGFGTAFEEEGGIQNSLSTVYNTESMFSDTSVHSQMGGFTSGVADQGTRLMVKFDSVPSGLDILVDNTNLTDANLVACIVPDADSDGSGGSPDCDSGTTELEVSDGKASAVWEVVSSEPAAVSDVYFGVTINYTAGSGTPGLGTMTAAGSLAPISTVVNATDEDPVPRFVETTATENVLTITACQTNLLFPFVTNQAGFDTGIAIANTSKDPYVDADGDATTLAQEGRCKLYYYGGTPGGGAAPAMQESAVIKAGETAVFTVGSGNAAYNVAATPGFQGYMIARCAFQYAHGFTFVSDSGSQKLAMGYLALVLDDALGTRVYPKTESEARDQ